MAPNKLEFIKEAGKLKHLPRQGWVIKNILNPETISGHMYRMALMAGFILDDYGTMDMAKIIRLCLIHDLGECIVGDITPHDNISKEEKHQKESNAIMHLASQLPDVQAMELKELFDEYEDQKTPESQFTKDLDIFDMVHQAFEYEEREFSQNGKIPDLSEFFDQTKVLSRIRNEEIKNLIRELVVKRDQFWLEKLDKLPTVNYETLFQLSQQSENGNQNEPANN